jgi:hypothetical protein
VIETEKFLTLGQVKRLDALLTARERDTGYRVRVLCQSYPNTCGLAIRDYWDLGKEGQKDEKYVVLVVDEFGGRVMFPISMLVKVSSLPCPMSLEDAFTSQICNGTPVLMLSLLLSEYGTLHDLFTIRYLNNIYMILCSLRRLYRNIRFQEAGATSYNGLGIKALICLVFNLRDFFGVRFGDGLANAVNGLDRKTLTEVISELTHQPRLGARLVLDKDIQHVLQG